MVCCTVLISELDAVMLSDDLLTEGHKGSQKALGCFKLIRLKNTDSGRSHDNTLKNTLFQGFGSRLGHFML